MTIQGYLKKKGSEKSWLHGNEFQERYFFLDIMTCQFKYAKDAGNPKDCLVIPFRDLISIENDPSLPPNVKVDTNYAFLFKIVMVKREMILAAATFNSREIWMNGFNFLFEFREHQNMKLNQIIPGGLNPGKR